MQNLTKKIKIHHFFIALLFSKMVGFSQEKISYSELSRDLLCFIKEGKSYQKEVDLLAKSSLKELTKQLKTDKQKMAFWLNIYNSFIQISLSKNPKLYKNKTEFFGEKRVKIAGELLSFDDIEHGILRKSKIKISLGYLQKWFLAEWERALRVETVDWRIHFALNCGAKSCPPVAIYEVDKLDKQLNFMTKTYLEEQTSYNSQQKKANTVALFSWFRGDFGGITGIKKILFDYKITPEKPESLNFKTYDWTLLLGNYRNIPN